MIEGYLFIYFIILVQMKLNVNKHKQSANTYNSDDWNKSFHCILRGLEFEYGENKLWEV